MARITIEDCLKNPKIKNKFHLVNVASHVAYEIYYKGSSIKRDNKPPVLALREIDAGLVDIDKVSEKIKKLRDCNTKDTSAFLNTVNINTYINDN